MITVTLPSMLRFYSEKMKSSLFIGASFLVGTTVLGNILNFIFNISISRWLSFDDLGLISLLSSFMYISSLFFVALGATITYRSGYLEGKYGPEAAYAFWRSIRRKSWFLALGITILWIVLTPFFVGYFNTNDSFPFLFFAPVWLVGFAAAIDKGFLSGKLLFTYFGLVILLDPVIKLLFTFIFIYLNISHFVYFALTFGVVISFLLGWRYAAIQKTSNISQLKERLYFPKKFFFMSLLVGASATSFLSMDIILAKHFLSAYAAGEYALVSIIGKIIYFLGTLASQFVQPVVSRYEGERTDSRHVFNVILLATTILSLLGFLLFGLLSSFSIPLLFGERAVRILTYLPMFTFGVLCFTISRVFVTYHQTKNNNIFPIISFFVISLQIILIILFHGTIRAIVTDMAIVGILHLLVLAMMHSKLHN